MEGLKKKENFFNFKKTKLKRKYLKKNKNNPKILQIKIKINQLKKQILDLTKNSTKLLLLKRKYPPINKLIKIINMTLFKEKEQKKNNKGIFWKLSTKNNPKIFKYSEILYTQNWKGITPNFKETIISKKKVLKKKNSMEIKIKKKIEARDWIKK